MVWSSGAWETCLQHGDGDKLQCPGLKARNTQLACMGFYWTLGWGKKGFVVWKAKKIGEKIYEKVAKVATQVRRLGNWYRYSSSNNNASLRWGNFNKEGASLSTEPWLWEGYVNMHLTKTWQGFQDVSNGDTPPTSMAGQPTPRNVPPWETRV